MSESTPQICLCTVCRGMLYEGDVLAEHFKYDFDGDLDYIELAHVECAWADNEQGETDYAKTYWRYDVLPPTT